MTTYAFIELPAALDGWVTEPGALFPVRSDRADDLQRADQPDPEQVLYDLERYLEEHPEKTARFAEAGGQLAFRTAVELFTNGLKDESLQFYELSLRLRPAHVITRLNYAVALHALRYRDAALAEYERLMTTTSPREQLRVWILAAQIRMLRGEHADVVRLLEPLAAQYFPTDELFWELLGDARRALPAAAPVAGASCGACGAALKPTAKFCPSCGKPVVATPAQQAPPPVAVADVCVHCGQPRRPGAKFCRSCGKA